MDRHAGNHNCKWRSNRRQWTVVAYIKQINVNNVAYDLKDPVARASIPFGRCDSTSTSTAFTATVPGITSLYDGVCVMLENGVVTSASGFTVDINGLGAKPVYNSMAAATRDTTIFNVAYTMLFVYDETRVEGGCWVCYRGYDANTNTIGYQIRTNATTMLAKNKGYRYRLWFTSPDGTKWVPANVSTSTNNTTARTANPEPIDPFGAIIYYSYNGTTNADAELTASAQWEQYTLPLGYSFTDSLPLTDNAPIYVKCLPQSDGSAIMQGTAEALPTTKDGYIYIYLGQAYSTTNIELRSVHPVYWHDGTGIRLWTGAEAGGAEALTDTEIEEAVDEAFVVSGYSVTISLTNPQYPERFTSGWVEVACSDDIYDTEPTQRLAEISSPTETLTVVVPSDVWGIELVLKSSFPGANPSNASCTGDITVGTDYIPGIVLFHVMGDGTITMDRVNYYDD